MLLIVNVFGMLSHLTEREERKRHRGSDEQEIYGNAKKEEINSWSDNK
jgi:hypothetical protein